jgi:hypothetical protein
MFLHVQRLKPQEWIILVFPTKCTPFFLKIRKDFNIDSAKGLELMNFFYNLFEHIWFKSGFGPENYGF